MLRSRTATIAAHRLRPWRRAPARSTRRGKLVLPGGIDAHAHVEQVSAGGIMNADTFESATTSAAFGGNTTLISFAAQHRGMMCGRSSTTMHGAGEARRADRLRLPHHRRQSRPTRRSEDLPALIKEGHSSIKVFMTYDLIKVDDEPLLDLLLTARAEPGAGLRSRREPRHDLLDGQEAPVDKGYTAPKYHAISHARGRRPKPSRG
jgi:dihydropyrimidinase